MVGNKYALGYHHSDAARAAISQKMKGRTVSQEFREKMRLIAVKRSAAKNSRQLELGF